jgi:hypothetical protein
MSSTKLCRCLILGGGPVAQGLARVHRTRALFSDSKFRNDGISASHSILTRDGTHPAEFRKLARKQISSYHNTDFVDTEITKTVNTTRKARTGFEVFDSKVKKWRAGP